MKRISKTVFLAIALLIGAQALALETIKLNPPNLERGFPVMKALSLRKTDRVFSPKELSLEDLSDLLWAAYGINRPDSGKRTAPSAHNAQDIDVYVCRKDGVYIYDAKENALLPVSDGDFRPLKTAPVFLIMVAKADSPYAKYNAAVISQNINIFCAGVGLATNTRASMDKPTLAKALKLNAEQQPLLNNPVGYLKE